MFTKEAILAAAKDAAQTKEQEKAAEKPAEPAVNHDAIISGVSDGLFDAVEPRKSHTRFEIGGKQVVYGERRKAGLSIVIASKLITDESLQELVTPQTWHGGRSMMVVTEQKKDINAARKLLKHVIANYQKALKDADEAKERTAEERKAKQAADRAEKRAAREAQKAQEEAASATAATEDVEDDEEEFDEDEEDDDE